ncbi:squamosa promoter-binding-like protein 12 isoform X1 [Camellia sinensis]|uniref:squamosa promoter-binding-like protein 12 isoform X1 n=1 Tax=Camellia sinensis TaxID=4442 RepID=UPI0010361AA7|nr:squamosa promoter-binding-like protein 12 isoform X1 [Camellia sinensis]
MKDQDHDLLSHLLRNLTSTDGSINGRNISGLLPCFQDLQNAAMSLGTPEKVPDLISNGPKCTSMLGSISKKDVCIDIQDPLRPNGQCMAFEGTEKRTITDNTQGGLFQTPYAIPCPTRDNIPAKASVPDNGVGRMKLNDIDLNTVYDDSQDCSENLESYHAPVNLGIGSLYCTLRGHHDGQKSSPLQTSRNTGSTSTQSLSSLSREAQAQGCTDRIVFKLFRKDPSDFPIVLRKQILDWLSHSPTEIESYIRPSCIILTIYL